MTINNPAVKPGEAAGTNANGAGFQSFAEFEAQMEKEGNDTSSVATQQRDGDVRPASQITAPVEEPVEEVEDGDAELTPEELAAAEAGEQTPPEAPKEAPKGPGKATLKGRLGQLVREKHEEAQRTAEATARAEAAEERARLAEERAANPDKPKPTAKKPTTTAAPVTEDDRPQPEDFEYGEFDPKYQDALVDWKVEQSLAKREARTAAVREETAQRTIKEQRQERWGTVIEKGAATNPDFEDKVLSGKGWKLSQQMWEMSVDSEVGADVLYHLASDPAESARIFDLPLTRQAAEFGKLEARFSQPSSGKGKSEVKADAVNHMPGAPKPTTPVRGAGAVAKTDAGTKDFAAFEAMMAREEAAKRKT